MLILKDHFVVKQGRKETKELGRPFNIHPNINDDVRVKGSQKYVLHLMNANMIWDKKHFRISNSCIFWLRSITSTTFQKYWTSSSSRRHPLLFEDIYSTRHLCVLCNVYIRVKVSPKFSDITPHGKRHNSLATNVKIIFPCDQSPHDGTKTLA